MNTSPEAPPPSQTRLQIDRARIRFLSRDGLLSVLEIETPADCDLLRPVYRALWSLRAQVVQMESRVGEGRVVHKLCVVEFDGGPIPAARRLEIQAAIIGVAGELLGGDRAASSDPVESALAG